VQSTISAIFLPGKLATAMPW